MHLPLTATKTRLVECADMGLTSGIMGLTSAQTKDFRSKAFIPPKFPGVIIGID